MTMGENMATARKAKGLTQLELGKQACISSSTIASWEEDKHWPSVVLASAVCDILGITIDEYIGRAKG